MPKLPIGARVRINPYSYFYGRDKYNNPANEIGEIIEYLDHGTDYVYHVKWKRVGNSYREEDLLLANEPKSLDDFM